jgi:hypothetical protein
MVIFRKVVTVALFGVFVAWLLSFCLVHISYASNLPDAPDTKTGKTNQLVVNHGFVRYGTVEEVRTLRWVENAQVPAIACLAMGIVLAARFKKGVNESTHVKPPVS